MTYYICSFQLSVTQPHPTTPCQIQEKSQADVDHAVNSLQRQPLYFFPISLYTSILSAGKSTSSLLESGCCSNKKLIHGLLALESSRKQSPGKHQEDY